MRGQGQRSIRCIHSASLIGVSVTALPAVEVVTGTLRFCGRQGQVHSVNLFLCGGNNDLLIRNTVIVGNGVLLQHIDKARSELTGTIRCLVDVDRGCRAILRSISIRDRFRNGVGCGGIRHIFDHDILTVFQCEGQCAGAECSGSNLGQAVSRIHLVTRASEIAAHGKGKVVCYPRDVISILINDMLLEFDVCNCGLPIEFPDRIEGRVTGHSDGIAAKIPAVGCGFICLFISQMEEHVGSHLMKPKYARGSAVRLMLTIPTIKVLLYK